MTSLTTYPRYLKRLTNLCLRMAGSLSRFFGLIILASILNLNDYATFGLITVFVTYLNIVMGGEIHSYTQRQFVNAPDSQKREEVFNHFTLIGGLSLIILFLSTSLFFIDYFDERIAGYFYMILIFELISKELYRFLISLQQQIWASITFFIRLAWPIPLVLFYLNGRQVDINFVLFCWASGTLLSSVTGALIIHRALLPIKKWTLSRLWVNSAFISGFVYLVITLSQHGLNFLSSIFINWHFEPKVFGAFFLFSSITLGIGAIADALVTSFYFSKMVEAFEGRGKSVKLVWDFFRQTFIVSMTAGVIIYLLFPHLMQFVGKTSYSEYSWMLTILLAISVIQNISQPFNLAVYAMKQDKVLLFFELALTLVTLCALVLISVFATNILIYMLILIGASTLARAVFLAFSFSYFCRFRT